MRIHDYIDYWSRREPDELYAWDGTRAVTWAEMRSWTNQIARWLGEQLAPGDRFGIVSKNSLEILALYFGASRVGAVPVPLNTRLAPAEWAFILGDAGVELVVAESEFGVAVDGIRDGLLKECCAIGDPRTGWRSFDDEVAARSGAPIELHVPDDQPLYQMYTSGTTGSPKGAVLTQRAVTANVVQLQTSWAIYRKNAMLVMPLFHAGSAVGAFLHAASGLRSRIMREFDAAEVLRILREEQVAVTTLVPAMIQFLLQEPGVADHDYPDLELVVYGASPIATDVLRQAMDVFGCQFVQAYGMTETSAVATNLDREDHVRALASDPRLLLSCGRPVVGAEVRVVDSAGDGVPPGEVGQVLVRGPQLMEGYWNLPDATGEALAGGWMHTGDAGSVDDEGYLYIRDRIKDMIVSGGENVYPRQIEEVLFSLPGINDVAVIGVPDDRWGEVPMALVVRAPGVKLTEAVIVEHCRSQLAGFKCPRSVAFVDVLPRTATGKVLKRELRAPYWEGRERAVV